MTIINVIILPYPIIIPTGYGKIITYIVVILNLSWIIIKTKSIKV